MGASEEVTGRALREMANMEEIVLATKVHFPMGDGPNMGGLSRKHILQACDASLKRLGVEGDWDNPYLTLNKEYEADELRMFADIVEQGFVYRGKKPVYWSIPCRTARPWRRRARWA